MSKNDWTNKLRDQLADYQEPASHDLWAGIESSLAHESQDAASSKRDASSERLSTPIAGKARFVAIKRWTAAAAIALLGVGGSYVYLHSSDSDETAVLANDSHSDKQLVAKGDSKNVSSVGGAVSRCRTEKGMKVASAVGSTNLLAEDVKATKQNSQHEMVKASGVSNLKLEALATATNEAVSSCEVPSASSQKQVASSQKQEASSAFGSTTFDSSVFSSHGHDLAWSVNLYAENMIANSQAGGANGASIASDPMSGGVFNLDGNMVDPGDFADKATFFAAATPWLRTSRYQKAKHHAPLAVGMQVGLGILPRLTLSTGVVYTRTSSDFQPNGVDKYSVHQVLHYVGVPLGVNYQVWSKSGFSAYVMAGGEADFNVKNDTEDSGHKEEVKRDRPQFSAKASLGLQYDIAPQVGLYMEPGAKYYFDNGSEIENTFKDKKLNFNFQFGLRWNIGK